MKKIYAFALCAVMTAGGAYASKTMDEVCGEAMTHLGQPVQSLEGTYKALDSLFKENKIADYTDAANREKAAHILGQNVDAIRHLNKVLGTYFIENEKAVYPQEKTHFDHIILGTSGINVLIERLALLAEMQKKGVLDVDRIVMLVGEHAHRKDLQDVDYLMSIAALFKDQFDLTLDAELRAYLVEKVKENWTHRTGAQVAWKLLASSPMMSELAGKFEFFSVDDPKARTEQLLEAFIKKNPGSKAFLCNAQGAPKTKQMVAKLIENPCYLICGPLTDEAETILHRDTLETRTLTRVFHLYRILEARRNYSGGY